MPKILDEPFYSNQEYRGGDLFGALFSLNIRETVTSRS